MKNALLSVLVLILVLPLIACDQPVAAELVMSDKPRETSPVVSEADLALLVEGNSAFTFQLYQALREEEGNPVKT